MAQGASGTLAAGLTAGHAKQQRVRWPRMTTTVASVCSKCRTPLPAREDPDAPCTACGHNGRVVTLEFKDEVKIYDGVVGESFDDDGPVAESVSVDTPQVKVSSHVDRQAGTFSTKASRGDEWQLRTKEAEEEAVGWAIARVLERETGVPWNANPVPKKEAHPDVRVTPGGETSVAPHEVEVRHLDDAAIAAINSGRGLTRQSRLQALEAMLKKAVTAKQKYDRTWTPKGTLALHVPVPVGAAYVQELRELATRVGDGFRELWFVADGTAHRLRP